MKLALGRLGAKQRTLVQRAIASLRARGTDAHLWLPGVGSVNGLTTGNYTDNTATVVGSVDSTQGVGLVRDALNPAGIHATQTTTGAKPYLRRGGYNLLLQSNTFNVSPWIQTRIAVPVVSGTSPVGDAWYVALDATTSATHALGQIFSFVSGQTYTFSALVKADTLGFYGVQLPPTAFTTAQQTVWNLATGATGNVSGTPIASRTVLSDGWQKVSITATATSSTAANFLQYFTDSISSTTVVTPTGKGLYISGAQLELGSTASDYSPTTTTAASNPAAGKYWWSFDGVTLPTDFLSLGSAPFLSTDDHCVIAGCSNQKASGDGIVFAMANDSAQRVAQIFYNNAVPTVSWVDDTAGGAGGAGAIQALGSTQVLSARRSGNSFVGRMNGAAFSTSTVSVGATTVTSQLIGSHKTTASNPFNGSIGPILAIKGTVSDTDLLLYERLIAALTPNAPRF